MSSKTTTRRRFLGRSLAAAGAASLASRPFALAGPRDDRFVVHEWGTFTTLQDETGRELHGINIDDEPVPEFVHNLNRFLLAKPFLTSLHWQYSQKSAPRHHPLVTMRLETPVIYFYPPAGESLPMRVDVRVNFLGGWLTEFYPNATPSAPGLKEDLFDLEELTPATLSGLNWNGLNVGVKKSGPETDQAVWLEPRKVNAAGIATSEGESERYLFYRGVGCQQAPLRVALDRQSGGVQIRGNVGAALVGASHARFGNLWLFHAKTDGRCAFRVLEGFDATRDENVVLREASYRFSSSDYSVENRQRLHAKMHAALTADGLFGDEAKALLSTWQRAYFLSPGLRLFYLVPRLWTDLYLPLDISPQPDLVRSMIGRIELVSDAQRAALDRLATATIGEADWVERIPNSPALDKFLAGRTDFGDLGTPIPSEYQLYLKLGRFRNALVTAEEARTGSASLTRFIDAYHLHPFRIPRNAVATSDE